MASHDSALAAARTFLFVPGNRPERFEKALAAGADAVIVDLEDAVPPDAKAGARESIAAAWSTLVGHAVPVMLRVNALDSPAGREDLEWLARLSPPAGVMIPKADSAERIAEVARRLPGVGIVPLIESAAGYANLSSVAAAPGVLRIAVGHLDFLVDTGIQLSEGEPELHSLRFAVSIATRMAKLAPAIEGVTTAIQDDELLRADTRRAMRYGFGAKLCIHPRQVAVVHGTMAPTEAELAWAKRVVEADAASNGAAVQLDGKMIDAPVVTQARRTLARAR